MQLVRRIIVLLLSTLGWICLCLSIAVAQSEMSVALTYACADETPGVGSTIDFEITGQGTTVYKLMAVKPDSTQTFLDGASISFAPDVPGTYIFIAYGANGTDPNASGFARCMSTPVTLVVTEDDDLQTETDEYAYMQDMFDQLANMSGPCNGIDHRYTTVLYDEEHPHQVSAYCICGASQPVYGKKLEYIRECCECNGHEWGEVVNTSIGYIQNCYRCNEQITVTPQKSQFMGDIFEKYRQIGVNELFETTSKHATKKMTEAGFVYINETIKATSDIGGSFVDTAIEIASGKATLSQSMVQEWEYLISQMLVSEFETTEANNTQNDENAAQSIIHVTQDVQQGLDAINKINELADKCNLDIAEMYFDANIDSRQKQIIELLDKGKDKLSQVEVDWLNELYNDADKLNQIADAAEKVKDAYEKANSVFEMVDVAMKAVDAGISEYEKQKLYVDIALTHENYCEKLDNLIRAGELSNNAEIVEAANNVKARLAEQMGNGFADEMHILEESGKTLLTEVVKFGAKKGVEKMAELAPPVKIIDAVGNVAKWALDWDEAYEKGFELQTLGMMNVYVRNEVASIFSEDESAAYQLTELYTILQIEGMNCSLEYLEAYEKGRGLSVKEFGIYSLEDARESVERRIDLLNSIQKNLNELYHSEWNATAQQSKDIIY